MKLFIITPSSHWRDFWLDSSILGFPTHQVIAVPTPAVLRNNTDFLNFFSLAHTIHSLLIEISFQNDTTKPFFSSQAFHFPQCFASLLRCVCQWSYTAKPLPVKSSPRSILGQLAAMRSGVGSERVSPRCAFENTQIEDIFFCLASKPHLPQGFVFFCNRSVFISKTEVTSTPINVAFFPVQGPSPEDDFVLLVRGCQIGLSSFSRKICQIWLIFCCYKASWRHNNGGFLFAFFRWK